jgi:hypothetical protein
MSAREKMLTIEGRHADGWVAAFAGMTIGKTEV